MSDQPDDIVVVSCGLRTPIGTNTALSAAGVRAKVSRLMAHRYLRDEEQEAIYIGQALYIDEEQEGIERHLQLAEPAISEALSQLPQGAGEVRCFVGLPELRAGLPENLQHVLLKDRSSEFISHGHASGLMALEKGMRCLESGEAEFCLVGGIDSYINPFTLKELERIGRLYCSYQKKGFTPGEAAGFCLLCTRFTAEKFGLSYSAIIRSVAVTEESAYWETKQNCKGKGLSKAVGEVLKSLPQGEGIGKIYTTLNGEKYHLTEFGYTLARFTEKIIDGKNFIAPVDCWGDIGAASAPVFIGLVTEAARKGYAEGAFSLICTSSLGKLRAAALLETNTTEPNEDIWL